MTSEEIRSEIALVHRSSRQTAVALVCVAVLALAFTMVNVTLFAIGEHIPAPIAVLLDPMASIALGSMILAEGALARYGRHCGPWAEATKWYAGLATWAMNVWSSVVVGSAAGVLLHSVAPGLVLGLVAGVPGIRRQFAAVIAELEQSLRERETELERERVAVIARDQAERLERAEAERQERAAELERIHRERLERVQAQQALAKMESAERVALVEQERLERQALELAKMELEHQERIQAHAEQVAAPARKPKSPPERQESDLERLIEMARPLVAQGLGRAAIQERLQTTEHWARKAIEGARKDRTPLHAVSR